jgi:hypothetical protein
MKEALTDNMYRSKVYRFCSYLAMLGATSKFDHLPQKLRTTGMSTSV